MDVRQARPTAPLSLALIMAMLFGIVFAAAPAADAQSTCYGHTVTVNLAAGQQPTNGNDVIMGTSGADTINAKSGNDIVCGRGGNDTINGQGGHDTIYGEGGADKIFGGSSGNDVIYGGNGADIIWGRNGNDTIYGQGGADKIYGEDGNDRLWGGNGPDRIWGGNGSDVINGEGSNDTLYGEGSKDTINGGYGTDSANGGGGTDKCDAETETNCETLQRPAWVHGAEAALTLERLGRFDFTISWPATTGSPDVFELTITDSNGTESLEIIDARSNSQFTIRSFNGAALDPEGLYTLEFVASNGAGSSEVLRAGPIAVFTVESETTTGHYLPASPLTIGGSTGSVQGRCTYVLTTRRVKNVIDVGFDSIITFDSRSDTCSDGTNIVENTIFSTCTDADGKTQQEPVLTREPERSLPQVPKVFNRFSCTASGQGSTGLEVSLGFLKFNLGGTGYIDVDLTTEHQIWAISSGICYKTVHTNLEGNFEPHDEGCPE